MTASQNAVTEGAELFRGGQHADRGPFRMRRWAEGMCSGTVTWARRPERRGWLATRCPLWKISTTAPQTRTSTSCRISPNGTEYQELDRPLTSVFL